MSIELSQLNVDNLRDTHESPITLHVPANEQESILIGCNPRLAPQTLVVAVHKRAHELRVLRIDEEPIQVTDAQGRMSPADAFISPVNHVEFARDETTGIWQYNPPEQVANAQLLNKFSFLIGTFAVSRQYQQQFAEL